VTWLVSLEGHEPEAATAHDTEDEAMSHAYRVLMAVQWYAIPPRIVVWEIPEPLTCAGCGGKVEARREPADCQHRPDLCTDCWAECSDCRRTANVTPYSTGWLTP